jgi:hypothetical protein
MRRFRTGWLDARLAGRGSISRAIAEMMSLDDVELKTAEQRMRRARGGMVQGIEICRSILEALGVPEAEWGDALVPDGLEGDLSDLPSMIGFVREAYTRPTAEQRRIADALPGMIDQVHNFRRYLGDIPHDRLIDCAELCAEIASSLYFFLPSPDYAVIARAVEAGREFLSRGDGGDRRAMAIGASLRHNHPGASGNAWADFRLSMDPEQWAASFGEHGLALAAARDAGDPRLLVVCATPLVECSALADQRMPAEYFRDLIRREADLSDPWQRMAVNRVEAVVQLRFGAEEGAAKSILAAREASEQAYPDCEIQREAPVLLLLDIAPKAVPRANREGAMRVLRDAPVHRVSGIELSKLRRAFEDELSRLGGGRGRRP